MPLELYQAETSRVAAEQARLLDAAKVILSQRDLTPLEKGGVLHAMQILIENAIGKAKQWLKVNAETVPVSGYDAFRSLSDLRLIGASDLPAWNAAIGLRNRLVHDYMNVDFEMIANLLAKDQERFIIVFLLRDFPDAQPAINRESLKP